MCLGSVLGIAPGRVEPWTTSEGGWRGLEVEGWRDGVERVEGWRCGGGVLEVEGWWRGGEGVDGGVGVRLISVRDGNGSVRYCCKVLLKRPWQQMLRSVEPQDLRLRLDTAEGSRVKA